MTSPAAAGVLLVNLGTPDAPTAPAIRRFLREFLADRRVVDLPRALWLPVLYGFILPFRPRRLAPAYASIWTPEGSPLLVYTRRLAERLGRQLGRPVVAAMRYGQPSVAAGLRALGDAGARRALVLPLYPQFSHTTTSSTLDAVAAAAHRAGPAPQPLEAYFSDPRYIAALADSVRGHWAASGRGDRLVVSFHSIPQRYVAAGDPYESQCRETARLLAQALELGDGDWELAYQSRLGREPWLQPYTDEVLPQLAARGVRTVDVICPGFAADCLETLEEVAQRYRAAFVAAGGSALRYIPALNDSPRHVDLLAALVEPRLRGADPSSPSRGATRP